MQRSLTAVAKSLNLILLLYALYNPLLNPIGCKISRFILQHGYKLQVNKTKKQAAIGRSFGKQY